VWGEKKRKKFEKKRKFFLCAFLMPYKKCPSAAFREGFFVKKNAFFYYHETN